MIGLYLILTAVFLYFFPPKFGSFFFGVRTNMTMKNKIIWAAGQRLFTYSYLAIGLIFSIIGVFKIDEIIRPFPMVVIFISLMALAKYIVHRLLVSKFPAV
jgi:multisubunit Na+/H+ antiporter MnhE subunit